MPDAARKPIITIKKSIPAIAVPRKTTVTMRMGDVTAVLRDLDANSFDGAFTDAPYGLTSIVKRLGKVEPPKKEGPRGPFGRLARGFMGKQWDREVPSAEAWAELLRVVKPGATLLAFGHPRTFHRLTCHIEDAGWILIDRIAWLYLTGYPKSRDLSKDIDRVLEARLNGFHETDGPIPVTSGASRWRGYGTALKPAHEDILVAMKPRDGSFAFNALKWGVAGLNIDGCRIACTNKTPFPNGSYHSDRGMYGSPDRLPDRSPLARFPANVIVDEEVARLLDEQGPITKGGTYRKSGQRDLRHKGEMLYGGGIGGGSQNAPDTYGDAGGISRIFYCVKSNKWERNAGLEGLPSKSNGKPNHHPTVKPLDLCKYLSTLILPPERGSPRKLIVPYAGVASEVIGGLMAGWEDILGIEMDPEYVAIANARIAYWQKRLSLG